MKTVISLLCLVLLSLTATEALPGDENAKKGATKSTKQQSKLPLCQPKKNKVAVPQFQWFGQAKKSDRC